jgi:DtxR family Mn-dependent transcriptional regulator
MGVSSAHQLTPAVQDYVKAIYALEAAGKKATTSSLAGRMGVKAPSAVAMTKRLAGLGLLERAPYRAFALTQRGRKVALEVLRHHRLIERLLVERLGYSLAAVHAEAELLEHALSAELEARIDAQLGFPTHDPHGHPIPDAKLRIERSPGRSLLQLAPAERATVARVPDGDPDLLLYLEELALVPGAEVQLRSIGPFDGPATVTTASGQHALSRDLADAIGVT